MENNSENLNEKCKMVVCHAFVKGMPAAGILNVRSGRNFDYEIDTIKQLNLEMF